MSRTRADLGDARHHLWLAQEKEGIAQLFDHGDTVGAVDVELISSADAIEIGDAVRDLHDCLLSTTAR